MQQRPLPWNALTLPLRGFFGDPAVRYGIKFGLAGVVAVFIALWIRLDEPVWALFTVFVLMIAQYVGAIAEKSVFRLAGTVIGGVSGFLITGAWEQNPFIFLILLGSLVGFCTAMFGQNRYPYAFLLTGMSAVVVASNGMADPANSWQYMIARIEEVSLGILVTVAVQSVIWPRYARREFLESLQTAFGDLRECLDSAPSALGNGTPSPGAPSALDFPVRISGLRTLLEFGARESNYFRERLATYYALTVCLAKIAYGISTLQKKLPPDSVYIPHVGTEWRGLEAALSAALADLSGKSSSQASRATARAAIASAAHDLDSAFMNLRKLGLVAGIPADQALVMGLHIGGLGEIRRQIETAHDLLDSLPDHPGANPLAKGMLVSPWPSMFWIHTGIKSGLAFIAAMAIGNWLNPPGNTMFILGTWMFVALNAVSPGGLGDRRAFHLVPINILCLAALSIVLIAASPMLASYAAMNTILFVWLFVWGFLNYRVRGMTIPMQLSMLMIVGILGLNGQDPVPFQSIVGFFFGLALALVLSALFQRLLWPSLPQWEIRARLLEGLTICRKLLAREPVPLWLRTRFALIPSEIEARLGHLEAPICPPEEVGKLRTFVQEITALGGNLAITAGDPPQDLPTEIREKGIALVRNLEEQLIARLEVIASAIRSSTIPPPDDSALLRTSRAWREWALSARSRLLEKDADPLSLAATTGYAERYSIACESVQSLTREAAAMRLQLYMGDYSL